MRVPSSSQSVKPSRLFLPPTGQCSFLTGGVSIEGSSRRPPDRCARVPCPQVPVQSWFDDMNDSELLDLLPFFEGLSKEDEVYGVLQDLRGR